MRSSKPVKPENSALADELRRNLKGKPTKSGFNRNAAHDLWGFISDILKMILVFVLCVGFALGGFGAGMLMGYASTAKPLSIGDLSTAEESQTSFVYDSEGNVLTKLTGSENIDRIYIPYGEVKDTSLTKPSLPSRTSVFTSTRESILSVSVLPSSRLSPTAEAPATAVPRSPSRQSS